MLTGIVVRWIYRWCQVGWISYFDLISSSVFHYTWPGKRGFKGVSQESTIFPKDFRYFETSLVLDTAWMILLLSWWIKTWWHTQHVWSAAFVAKGYVVVFPITSCVILIISLGNYRNNATGTCRSHIDLKETCLTFAEKPFEQKMEGYFVDLNHLSHKSVWLWSVSRRQDQTSTVTVTSFATKCAASAGVKGPRRQRQNRHPPQVWQKGMSFGIWGCLKLRELESWIVLKFLVISNNFWRHFFFVSLILRRAPFWSFL